MRLLLLACTQAPKHTPLLSFLPLHPPPLHRAPPPPPRSHPSTSTTQALLLPFFAPTSAASCASSSSLAPPLELSCTLCATTSRAACLAAGAACAPGRPAGRRPSSSPSSSEAASLPDEPCTGSRARVKGWGRGRSRREAVKCRAHPPTRHGPVEATAAGLQLCHALLPNQTPAHRHQSSTHKRVSSPASAEHPARGTLVSSKPQGGAPLFGLPARGHQERTFPLPPPCSAPLDCTPGSGRLAASARSSQPFKIFWKDVSKSCTVRKAGDDVIEHLWKGEVLRSAQGGARLRLSWQLMVQPLAG